MSRTSPSDTGIDPHRPTSLSAAQRPFLTAEWRHLVMLNWRVDPALLEGLVPAGTSLDTSDGSHYVSLVGFLFRDTRVLGVAIPFHRDFEEINLRFYVSRRTGTEVRRGVCFIRELVPRAAIAIMARLTYNEPYVAVPMRHHIEPATTSPNPSRVEYGWRMRGQWHGIEATPAGEARTAATDSHEAFHRALLGIHATARRRHRRIPRRASAVAGPAHPVSGRRRQSGAHLRLRIRRGPAPIAGFGVHGGRLAGCGLPAAAPRDGLMSGPELRSASRRRWHQY